MCVVMRGTLPALRIADENFPLGDVARSENGELSKNGHRPLIVCALAMRRMALRFVSLSGDARTLI